jgi:hypothetical protein
LSFSIFRDCQNIHTKWRQKPHGISDLCKSFRSLADWDKL